MVGWSRGGMESTKPFTREEFVAIHLGAGDDLSSLREPSRFGRLVQRMLGFRPVNRLADPRLEMLRHTTMRLRLGKALSPEARAQFHAAGFEDGQLEILMFVIGAA